MPAVASVGPSPTVPVQEPGDHASPTSGPDEATPTLQDGVELEAAEDPAAWEQYLTEAGVTSVSCALEASGDDSYTLIEEPPQDLEWVTAALLTELSIYYAVYWEYFLPSVGDELFFYETDPGGPTEPVDFVVLCSGDASEWVGFESSIDPAVWEQRLTASPGVTAVECTAEDVAGGTYTISSPAPAGTEWLLLLLVPAFEPDNERFLSWDWEGTLPAGEPPLHRVDRPQTGVEYVVPNPGGDEGATLPVDQALLCAGGQSPDGEDDGGDEALGPPIETDVPAPTDGPGAGVVAALVGVGALLAAAARGLRRSG